MRKFFSLFIIVVLVTVFIGCSSSGANSRITFTPPQIPCEKFVEEYHTQGRSYKTYVDDDVKYDYLCDFFKWSNRNYNSRQFSSEGVPLVKYYGKDEMNPCTILQYTLAVYGRYLKGESSKEDFLKVADYCIGMMSEDGSFRYNFGYRYYVAPGKYYKTGWTSSMPNGHMLQVMARAYSLTKDPKYIKAGNSALDFLNVPIEAGGVKTTLKDISPDLESYVMYEEYPCTPATYTLNGYMFTLIGIYDWSCLDGTGKKKEAEKMFKDGIETLKVILPAYDLGGITCYDLSYLTWKREKPHVASRYHAIHVAFCKIFFDITGDEEFNFYFKKWKDYVEKDNDKTL